MENFPVINLENINGEERKTILDQIQDACQNWGFFEMRTEMKKLDKDVSLSVIAMKTPGFSGEDPSLISKNQLLARIVGGLGERAEEEVIFSETEITTGAAMDLQQITQIVRQMVTKFGMSKIGPWALTDPAVQDKCLQQLVAHSLAPPGIRTIPPSPKWLSTSHGCIEAHLTDNRYDFCIDIEVFRLWFLLACFQGACNLYSASFQKNDIIEIETIGCSEPVGFIITKIDEFWQLKQVYRGNALAALISSIKQLPNNLNPLKLQMKALSLLRSILPLYLEEIEQ
ncbi:hypothetical protein JHK85_040190 [Glycine max]|nr:hypothetical protein JHK86_039612 [Glycine max]KAG4965215.1 hypothetical protein JHK85_040190 [Glycine max]